VTFRLIPPWGKPGPDLGYGQADSIWSEVVTRGDEFRRTLLAEAERWAPFLANCMAASAGYFSHPSSGDEAPKPRHPFPRSIALDGALDGA
jgi:hypothetical protein